MSNGNTCPIDHGTMRWLWEHNKVILDELREVVEPLSEHLSSRVEADAARWDVVAYETQGVQVQRGIPFGEPYTFLPPRLFDRLADITTEAPVIPSEEAEIKQLIDAYKQRQTEPPAEGMEGWLDYRWSTTGERTTNLLYGDLKDLSARGVRIDAATWERYKEVGRQQARAGRYELDFISARRAKSIKNMRSLSSFSGLVDTHATGNFDNFMAMPTSALDVGGLSKGLAPVGYLFMPVGDYGSKFAEKLLRTTAGMVNVAGHSLRPLAARLAQEHRDVIVKHTARGKDGRPLDTSLIVMTQEGARSIMEATALLTANKVEGYDDPDRLFEAIVEQGILEQFTRSIPMGVLGPTAFSGKYFPHVLQHKGNGKLALNPGVMSAIKRAGREVAAAEAGSWMTYWALPEDLRKETAAPAATSLICPAAMPHGALQRMAGAMCTAFKAFRSESYMPFRDLESIHVLHRELGSYTGYFTGRPD